MKLCGLILCCCVVTGRFTIASAYFMNDMILHWFCVMPIEPVIISVDEDAVSKLKGLPYVQEATVTDGDVISIA